MLGASRYRSQTDIYVRKLIHTVGRLWICHGKHLQKPSPLLMIFRTAKTFFDRNDTEFSSSNVYFVNQIACPLQHAFAYYIRESFGWPNLRRTFPLVHIRVTFYIGKPEFSSFSCTSGFAVDSKFLKLLIMHLLLFAIERIEFVAEAFVRFRATRFCILSCAVNNFRPLKSSS